MKQIIKDKGESAEVEVSKFERKPGHIVAFCVKPWSKRLYVLVSIGEDLYNFSGIDDKYIFGKPRPLNQLLNDVVDQGYDIFVFDSFKEFLEWASQYID